VAASEQVAAAASPAANGNLVLVAIAKPSTLATTQPRAPGTSTIMVSSSQPSSWPTGPSYLQRSTDDPAHHPDGCRPAAAHPVSGQRWDAGGSTLDGQPQWIQDANHADCPECGQPMDYLGLVGGADLDDLGEGAYSLQLHAPVRPRRGVLPQS
jgi:hypothetical protein